MSASMIFSLDKIKPPVFRVVFDKFDYSADRGCIFTQEGERLSC